MNVKALLHTASLYTGRNRIILSNPQQPCAPDRVNLHYWRAGSGKVQNLGDYLSTVVVDWAKEHHGLSGIPGSFGHLYAIGSILSCGFQNAAVWGSGFLNDPALTSRSGKILHSSTFRKLDVRAVRGPHTRDALLALGHQCPEVYGDPAILMPRIYTPRPPKKREPYCLISHMADHRQYDRSLSILTDDYRSFLDRLCGCDLVISGSLHGIILAESYGIPAVLLLPAHMAGDLTLYKYEDYYHGTGRDTFPVARTPEEALTLAPAPLPRLEEQQDRLLSAFPVDLWKERA